MEKPNIDKALKLLNELYIFKFEGKAEEKFIHICNLYYSISQENRLLGKSLLLNIINDSIILSAVQCRVYSNWAAKYEGELKLLNNNSMIGYLIYTLFSNTVLKSRGIFQLNDFNDKELKKINKRLELILKRLKKFNEKYNK